jgi:hypothetical protein
VTETETEMDRVINAIAEAFGVSNPTPAQRKAVREELEAQPCAEDVV